MFDLSKGHGQSLSNQNLRSEVSANLWMVLLVEEGTGVLWDRVSLLICWACVMCVSVCVWGGQRHETPDREILLEDAVPCPDGWSWRETVFRIPHYSYQGGTLIQTICDV